MSDERLEFYVHGSALEPYRVTFIRRSPGNLSAYCTCRAGENGQYCKHRFGIMGGSTQGLASDNADDVKQVLAWLRGSDLERSIAAVSVAEQACERAKRELQEKKRELARAMRD